MNPRHLQIALLGCAGLLITLPANAIQTYKTIRPVLIEALQNGEAHGVLGGDAPNTMKQMFGTSEPLYVDVKRTQILSEPGCGVVEIVIRQDGVKEPPTDAKRGATTPVAAIEPSNKTFKMPMRYCIDGHAPMADLTKEQRAKTAKP